MSLVKGFSLIELLVVIAIVGILSIIGVSAYSSYTERAKLAGIQSYVNHLQREAVRYYEFNNVWPSLSDLYSSGVTNFQVNFPVANVEYALMLGNANCGYLEYSIDPTNFSGAPDYMVVAMIYGYHNGTIQIACDCETDLGWGPCTGTSSIQERLSCDIMMGDQDFTCNLTNL